MLYRACRPLGLFAPMIDEMEFWQVAATLGVDEVGPDWSPTGVVPPADVPPPEQATGPVLRSFD